MAADLRTRTAGSARDSGRDASSAAADGTALVGEIMAVLREHGDDVLACLLPMLRAAGPSPSTPIDL